MMKELWLLLVCIVCGMEAAARFAAFLREDPFVELIPHD
jgi:hypothetical protein